ncbi:hypothetical protein J4216_01185 [Candidatus Woesearchaeota archaeon]|nr:hypothetical protein [Candidatus Woesearchaeota archaeon]
MKNSGLSKILTGAALGTGLILAPNLADAQIIPVVPQPAPIPKPPSVPQPPIITKKKPVLNRNPASFEISPGFSFESRTSERGDLEVDTQTFGFPFRLAYRLTDDVNAGVFGSVNRINRTTRDEIGYRLDEGATSFSAGPYFNFGLDPLDFDLYVLVTSIDPQVFERELRRSLAVTSALDLRVDLGFDIELIGRVAGKFGEFRPVSRYNVAVAKYLGPVRLEAGVEHTIDNIYYNKMTAGLAKVSYEHEGTGIRLGLTGIAGQRFSGRGELYIPLRSQHDMALSLTAEGEKQTGNTEVDSGRVMAYLNLFGRK